MLTHINRAQLKSITKKLRNSTSKTKIPKFSCRCLATVVAMATNPVHEELETILAHINRAQRKSITKNLRNSTSKTKIPKFSCRCLATVVAMATNLRFLETRAHASSYKPNPIEIRPQKVEKFNKAGFVAEA